MRNSFRGSFLFILGVTISGFLFSVYYTRSRDIQQASIGTPVNLKVRSISTPTRIVPPSVPLPSLPSVPPIDPQPPQSPSVLIPEDPVRDCECTSETTGKKYDFCYRDPQNLASIGRKFDCGHLKFLEKLNLVDNPGPFVNLSDALTIEKEIVIVGAISDNHFNEGTGSLAALEEFNRTAKYIIYGLNLSPKYAKHFEIYKNVEYRPFNTTGYPEYVNNWMTYRFKPLIIAEVMKEYPNIWWMDAHVTVKKPNMIQALTQEIATKRQRPENPLPSSIIFFIHASHSNFAVMFPKLLDYFPTNSIPLLKSEQRGAQLGANTFFVARTEYTVKIFKWWILCALDEKCMNPRGAQVYCSFNNNRFDFFANCFRFDQSVLNLLLLNDFQDHHKYYSDLGHFF